MSASRVRVFVSSPSDLDRERLLVKDLVERLGEEYLPYFRLKPVLWEEEALTAAQSFQDGLVQPADCEIVLVMLWTRLGTPLADRPYGGMTGTEWELLSAVSAHVERGSPEVLVYKKTAPRLVDVTDSEATREAMEDRARLETFFRTHFFNEDGSFRRAFRQFDSDRTLRELIEGQLRKLLNRRIGAERGGFAGAADWQDNPFRAGTPFESADAPVFVGREAEIRTLVAELDASKGPGRGLVLIAGPSGVGKTSLIRAGLLPRLTRPFLFPGIALCRWCLVGWPAAAAAASHRRSGPSSGMGPAAGERSEPPADPLASLAGALADPGLLGPALADFGLDAAALARLLKADPEVAADQVRAAVQRLGSSQHPGAAEGRVQLAVILDPLDGLLAGETGETGEAGEAHRSAVALAAALAALAERDGIWVVAALRSDRLRELARLPPLAASLERAVRLDLEPPPPARIRQVMEIPARVAGIEYEEGLPAGGHGLVEVLELEAARLTHWPALLQRTLSALYARAGGDGGPAGLAAGSPGALGHGTGEAQAGTGSAARERPPRRLALADYRALGGIAGTALRAADSLWADLDPAVRAALPRLARALLALDGSPGARPQPRAGDLRTLVRERACAGLIGALVEARLAVTEGVPDPALHTPCPRAEESFARGPIRMGAGAGTGWRIRRRGGPRAGGGAPADAPGPQLVETRANLQAPRAAADRSAEPGARSVRSTPDAAPPLAPDTPEPRERHADLAALRPAVTLAHPVLVERWAPLQDWLRDPANRRDLDLRGRLDRQAALWKRTDCNREHLLGEQGFAAARAFADRHGDELTPLEREYLDRSAANLRRRRGERRAVRLVGLTLALLLGAASGAAWWAFDASRRATLNLHRSWLNAADLEIARGSTAEAVRLAYAAAPSFPGEAASTLSRAFTSNRLVAAVRTGDPRGAPHTLSVPGRTPAPPAPKFADDGTLLAAGTADGKARVWTVERDRFVPAGDLPLPDPGIHSLRFAPAAARDGRAAELLGVGTGGIWRLGTPGGDASATEVAGATAGAHPGGRLPSARAAAGPPAPGPAPDWPCTADRDTPIALDAVSRRLAVVQRGEDGGFALCVADLARPGSVLWGRGVHERDIRDLRFAPGGRWLASASRDGTAKVLDGATGVERTAIRPLGAMRRPVGTVALDPRGTRVAVGAADERIRVYDLDGRMLAELGDVERGGRVQRIHQSAIRALVFSSDGRWLLAGDDEGQVVRWDPAAGSAELLGQHGLGVGGIRVLPRDDPRRAEPLAVSAAEDGTARLWGLESRKEIATLTHRGAVSDAGFAADGEHVLTVSEEGGTARVWSVEPNSTLALRLPHDNHVRHLDLVPAPPGLAGGPPASVGKREIAPAAAPGGFGGGAGEGPSGAGAAVGVRGAPRGAGPLLLATASYDGTVPVWRWDPAARAGAGRDGSPRQPAGPGAPAGPEPEGSPDTAPASAPAPGAPPELLWRFSGHTGRVREVAFSPSAEILASTGYDGTLRLWDLASGAGCTLGEGAAAGEEPVGFYIALFAPDESWLLSASNDPARPLRLWDPAACTERPLPTPLAHRDPTARVQAAALAAAPDGATLVASGNDAGELQVTRQAPDGSWTRLCRRSLGSPVDALAFAPEGAALAAADEGGRGVLLELGDTGCGPPRFLDGGDPARRAGPLRNVAFAPDGRMLVTASDDGLARVYARDGRALALLAGHRDRVYDALFSPDGRWILTGSRDGSLRLWERPPERHRERRAAHRLERSRDRPRHTADPPVRSAFLTLANDLGSVAHARFTPDGRSFAAAYWQNAAVLWRLWGDPNPPEDLIATWGETRARLALIQEAARFRAANRLTGAPAQMSVATAPVVGSGPPMTRP